MLIADNARKKTGFQCPVNHEQKRKHKYNLLNCVSVGEPNDNIIKAFTTSS